MCIRDRFKGGERLESVVLKNLKTGELDDVKVDTCFIFIGYLPNTEIFKGIVDMNRAGYLITNEKMETNIPGVYAAGDVRDKWLKQVSTAVGDGAIAGYACEKYIAESEQFENQIMAGDLPGLVFVYNAVDPKARALMPVIEQFEETHAGRVKVTRVDVYKSEAVSYTHLDVYKRQILHPPEGTWPVEPDIEQMPVGRAVRRHRHQPQAPAFLQRQKGLTVGFAELEPSGGNLFEGKELGVEQAGAPFA